MTTDTPDTPEPEPAPEDEATEDGATVDVEGMGDDDAPEGGEE
jgi:hypothetical protein